MHCAISTCGIVGWPPLPRTNLQQVKAFLFSLEPGGDFVGKLDRCEDVIGALSQAIELEWQGKTRMLYLLCDDPPHGRRFTCDKSQEILSQSCLVRQKFLLWYSRWVASM